MSESLPEGVRFLDHTADVGLELEAPDLETLFLRAAQGAEALVGTPPEPADAGGESIAIALEAGDVAWLLAEWLRELLFLRQVRGRSFVDAQFQELTATRLAARVRLAPAGDVAIREIKGVTYHGLEAVRRDDSWYARVIFDV